MHAHTLSRSRIVQVTNTNSADQVPMRSRANLICLRKAGAGQRQMEKGCAIRVWQRERRIKGPNGLKENEMCDRLDSQSSGWPSKRGWMGK